MISKIRKTITGTEYWDSENKKTVLVPDGEEIKFEVGEVKAQEVGQGKVEGIELDSLTIAQLKEYAASKGIEIPKEITKRDDIIEFLS
ncbi:Ish1 domain-containing protein [Lactococcus lactis]|uniref:Ish1 domain-containing protein n=1 Tax=Lactococcus lactis TaxID=1358 RepID=UPI001111275C|nr:Ish1 domain-containing protein [Lactococcus lactis]MDT2902712.1 Ish1 domain-containing protein [Lactococcus lactis]